MTAARKLTLPAIADNDPLWQRFLAAPFDTHPAPPQEALALSELGSRDFVDAQAVRAEIAGRRRAEEKTTRRVR